MGRKKKKKLVRKVPRQCPLVLVKAGLKPQVV
jgi:hypothetical protein